MHRSLADGERAALTVRPFRILWVFLALGTLWVVGTSVLPAMWPSATSRVMAEYRYLLDALFLALAAVLVYRGIRAPQLTRFCAAPSWGAIIEAFGAIILLVDEQGVIIDCNAQAVHAYRYPREELIGMPYARLQSEHHALTAEIWAHGMVEQGALFEEEHCCGDGAVFPVSVSVRTIIDQGRKQHFIDVRDITDRKQSEAAMHRAEAALRRQERFLSSIFASIQDGISVLDTELNIVQINPAMERWFAEQPALIGCKCYTVYYGHEAPCEDCPSMRTIQTGKAHVAYLPHYDADGTLQHWFELHSFPLIDADSGAVTGVIEYLHDITERKAIEDELKQKTAELADSNAELQQFAYVASHDLQEPLRMVASYVQLLERRYMGRLDDDADEFIAFAVDGASRMKTLINDLLSYSRVGTQGNAFEMTDCNEVLQRALTNLQVAIEEQGATIIVEPLPAVTADPMQLLQLFQNLIGNAIKFHCPGTAPCVRLRAEDAGKEWAFTVADNGIGLNAKYGDRIFTIFQRLHGKGEYPGTGIGLAICKKIVDRHGGRIWVESEEGQGATFHFTLPKNPHKARAAKTDSLTRKTAMLA